jgi:hypothetical protein
MGFREPRRLLGSTLFQSSSRKVSWNERVDRERCQGHAGCFALAPELFELEPSASASIAASAPIWRAW